MVNWALVGYGVDNCLPVCPMTQQVVHDRNRGRDAEMVVWSFN